LLTFGKQTKKVHFKALLRYYCFRGLGGLAGWGVFEINLKLFYFYFLW
jgi:hypothetical protein